MILHTFDGQMLTVPQIMQRVPILSERAIRRHLQAGRCTREAMLSHDVSAARRRGGQTSHARARKLAGQGA